MAERRARTGKRARVRTDDDRARLRRALVAFLLALSALAAAGASYLAGAPTAPVEPLGGQP